jgi:hypothetical protein
LAKEGGALAEFLKPLRFGVGAYFGAGQTWYSWIHRDDLCDMFIWALENPAVEGIFNGVAPHPVRNKDLVISMIKNMGYRALPVSAPIFILRLMLGELAAGVLNSNLVSCDKIRAAGFHFKYPFVDDALTACRNE